MPLAYWLSRLSPDQCDHNLHKTTAFNPVGVSRLSVSRCASPLDSRYADTEVRTTPVLHYLPLWPTRLSRRDIADRDSNVWEFLTSGNSDARLLWISRHTSSTMDGSELIGISRIAIPSDKISLLSQTHSPMLDFFGS
jgi:hypothetical protein